VERQEVAIEQAVRGADPGSTPGRARVRLLTGERAIWLLNFLVALLALVLFVGPVHGLPAVESDHLPWWALAPMFFAAERCVVHLHFRRSAHSFSLGDLPFVFGLLYASPFDLMVGALVGTAAVLITGRRQPAIKLVFNLAQLSLGICLAVLVLHSIAPGGGYGPSPQVWAGVAAAALASAVVGVTLIGTAITLSEGRVKPRTMAQMLSLDSMITLTNTSVALLAALVVSVDMRGLPLLILPLATLFFAYRSYILERQKHDKLEFLHETTQTLSRSPEVLGALESLLQRSLEAFRAEFAEIVLFGADEATPLRTTLDAGGDREVMQPADPSLANELLSLVSNGTPAVTIQQPFSTEQLHRSLASRGVSNAMVALLPGEERVIGTIMLANRLGVVSSFSAEDLKLLQTLASNASVALQFDRLEQAMSQLRTARDQLEHQALHDPLTGLANRTLFMKQLTDALAGESPDVGVLFIDVDDFKTVNDTLGHAAGDELLVVVARQARECVLPSDLVARLGGDEFAVMVRDADDVLEAALAVTRRLMETLERPLRIGGQAVAVQASVGIATNQNRAKGAEELIQAADAAMYRAKAAGKHRFRIFDDDAQASAA
jgi:diguanylate cyclase (GGDEF)-like protein